MCSGKPQTGDLGNLEEKLLSKQGDRSGAGLSLKGVKLFLVAQEKIIQECIVHVSQILSL